MAGLEAIRVLPPAAQLKAVEGLGSAAASYDNAYSRAEAAYNRWAQRNPNAAEAAGVAGTVVRYAADRVTGKATGSSKASKNTSATGNAPTERYNRQKHYGGSQTTSPAAQAARKAGEGKPCPTCGQEMVSGTKTAPSPQHNPPLSQHYYEHGGSQMTNAERAKHAQTKGIDGAQCLTCQRKEGAEMSRYSREQAKKHGLQ